MPPFLLAFALILAPASPVRAEGSAPPPPVEALISESQRLQLTSPKAGLAKAEAALALLPPGAHPRTEAALLLEIARLDIREGRHNDALEALRRAEPLARAEGMGQVSRGLMVIKALALNLKGDRTEAQGLGEQALAEAKAAGDGENQVEALGPSSVSRFWGEAQMNAPTPACRHGGLVGPQRRHSAALAQLAAREQLAENRRETAKRKAAEVAHGPVHFPEQGLLRRRGEGGP